MNDHLTRASRLAVLALIVFLLAALLATVERNQALERDNKRALATLTQTNRGIVDKLTEVFETTQRAEDAARAAGTVPQETVAAIAESLKGYVDPALIQKAIDAARTVVSGSPSPSSTTSTSPRTTTTTAPASTSTTAATTTTTSHVSGSTTTSSSTTTTTARPCAVVLLGIRLLC